MVANKTKPRSHAGAVRREIRLRGKRILGIDKELAMVRTGSPRKGLAVTRRSDQADVMVRKLGKALSKPGISKGAIFHGSVVSHFSPLVTLRHALGSQSGLLRH